MGASARLFELIDRKPELNSAGGLAKDTLHGSTCFAVSAAALSVCLSVCLSFSVRYFLPL